MIAAPAGAVDVVIPAHDEEAALPACLASLLAQRGVEALNLCVVANGCSDRTAEVARSYREAAAAAGHRLAVLELPEAGKAGALNAADPPLDGETRVYLDADTALSAGALLALHRELAGAGPRLASPLPLPLLPADRLARSYAEVWMRLPSVAGQVVGLGCYAVNRAGRERWSAMPRIVADDAFVRSRFAAGERRLLEGEQMVNAFPSGRALLGVLRRWRDGNRELARLRAAADPRASRRSALLSLAAQPSAWPHLPAFAAVSGTARLGGGTSPWARAPRRGPRVPVSLRPKLAVTVVAGGRSSRLDRCLRSLEPILATAQAEVEVVEDPARAGGSVTGDPAELVLLIGADVVPGPGAIELLLLVARRFPWAGIYGGREARQPGGGRLPGPEAIRRVAALPGGLLMVGGRAWKAVGGWDGRPGADPGRQLCARALGGGFTPLQVSPASFSRAAEPRY
ncbi:MAG: glycosyltransferase [Solirubrobacterales bacterium]